MTIVGLQQIVHPRPEPGIAQSVGRRLPGSGNSAGCGASTIPKAPVEAFHKAILPRAARFDVQSSHPILLEPPLHDGGNELRAAVAPKIRRRSVLLDGLLEPFQDVLGSLCPIRPQDVAFPCALVQDRWDPY